MSAVRACSWARSPLALNPQLNHQRVPLEKWIWMLIEDAELRRFLDLGAEGLLTDLPDLGRGARRIASAWLSSFGVRGPQAEIVTKGR